MWEKPPKTHSLAKNTCCRGEKSWESERGWNLVECKRMVKGAKWRETRREVGGKDQGGEKDSKIDLGSRALALQVRNVTHNVFSL